MRTHDACVGYGTGDQALPGEFQGAARCRKSASQRAMSGWSVSSSQFEEEIFVKRVLASILLPAGASIAFAVNAGGGSVPAGNRGEPTVAVERGAQAVEGRFERSDLVEGEVRWVDPAAGKLTVMHGQHNSLGMPPMTMVVRVRESGRLTQFRAGDKIRFAAERVNGLLTTTVLQPAK